MKKGIYIRKGNKNQEPMIVYVDGKNDLDYYVCYKLNTGDVLMSKKEALLNFNYWEFKIMFYKWKLTRFDLMKKNFTESINEALDKIKDN
jgi:hypothetical protein